MISNPEESLASCTFCDVLVFFTNYIIDGLGLIESKIAECSLFSFVNPWDLIVLIIFANANEGMSKLAT